MTAMKRTITRALWATAATAVLVCAAPANAQLTRNNQNQQQQQLQNISPPRPGKADRPQTLWMIIMAVVLGGAIAGVAFIPSKRGHQD